MSQRLARRPPPVTPGDTVGVAALSGPVTTGDLERGTSELRRLGFVPKLAANLAPSRQQKKDALFQGRDEERLAGFHALIDDPEVRAICFARGGHGVLRLLPGIDWRRIAKRPLAYVGYSDLTPLLLEITRRTGWATLHGPMVAVDLARGLDDRERRSFLAALAGDSQRVASLRRVAGCESAPDQIVEAPLVGGCLSMIAATLGTRFAAHARDSILFLEDVGEPVYRLDRMLTQLELAGALDDCRALILGHLGDVVKPASMPWRECLKELAERRCLPLLSGVPAGHGAPNLTLPMGVRVRLDLKRRALTC